MKRYNNMYELDLEMKVGDYAKYIEVMEESINSRKNILHSTFEKQSEEFTEDEKQEFYEYQFLDDVHELSVTFPFILRKSLFITLYSFMEAFLGNLAVIVEKNEITNKKLEEVNHNGLYKYHLYITDVCKIDIGLSQDDQGKFLLYNGLRNYFVHNEGSRLKNNKFNSLEGVRIENLYDTNEYYVKDIDENFNDIYLEQINKYLTNTIDTFIHNKISFFKK